MKFLVVVAIVFALIFGLVVFANCYSEHRQRGFSFWTAMVSCDGS